MVHTVDGRSNKSGPGLLPLTAHDLAKLASKARAIKPNSVLPPAGPETRSLRRRLTPEAREAIVSRYEAGESAKALSQEYGVSRDGVTRLLKSAGVAIRTQFVVTLEAAVRIVELYESG